MTWWSWWVMAGFSAMRPARVCVPALLVTGFARNAPLQTNAATNNGSISLAAENWTFIGSGMPNHPTDLANGSGWYFNFPTYSGSISDCGVSVICPHVGYVATSYRTPIKGSSLSITLAVATSSGAVFRYQTVPDNTCVLPARVRAYIERKGDDYKNEYYRWWSNPISYQVASGSASVTTPLSPDQWSDVYGRFGNADAMTTSMFYAAFQNPENVGMTFGGGCFFGHGVFVTGGTAQFTLTGYTINP